MVEGAKSFFKSTASEIDDKNIRALSNTESYTILNLIVPQSTKTVEHLEQCNSWKKDLSALTNLIFSWTYACRYQRECTLIGAVI
jgi:hypothetical protein